EIAGSRRNCPLRVLKRDLGCLLGQRFYDANAVLRMAHFHSDMERFDVHVALEAATSSSKAQPSSLFWNQIPRRQSVRALSHTFVLPWETRPWRWRAALRPAFRFTSASSVIPCSAACMWTSLVIFIEQKCGPHMR